MDAAALQGRALGRLVDDLQAFLHAGESGSASLWELAAPVEAGLWRGDGGRLTAMPRLVALANALPGDGETLPAVFSLVPEVRGAWRRVVLARLWEMGERKDLGALCEAVTAAGVLAGELVDGVTPSLSPTPFGELERLVLPAPAQEAPAFPVLLRVLAATAGLLAAPDGASVDLKPVVGEDPTVTWVRGRLLRLPAAEDTGPAAMVLTGTLHDPDPAQPVMEWVLARPWAFLLGQLVFTQEAWEAERIAGGISFELEAAHLPVFQHPPCVDVVVTLPSGEEVRCGTLGELVLQVLAELGVTILAHRVSAPMLDARLGLVVQALLRREVWRFDHGSGGRRPGYAIHPNFSDACYRTLGSKAFYRLGSHVTATVRRVAETWARDRVARAGGAAAGEGAA